MRVASCEMEVASCRLLASQRQLLVCSIGLVGSFGRPKEHRPSRRPTGEAPNSAELNGAGRSARHRARAEQQIEAMTTTDQGRSEIGVS